MHALPDSLVGWRRGYPLPNLHLLGAFGVSDSEPCFVLFTPNPGDVTAKASGLFWFYDSILLGLFIVSCIAFCIARQARLDYRPANYQF